MSVIHTPFGDWGGVTPPNTPPTPPPVPTPFVPTFEVATETVNLPNGTTQTFQLNPFQFATEATAIYLAQRFGAIGVVAKAFPGVGGPYSTNVPQRFLLFDNSVEMNAGLLASYFIRGPEDQFPGWAQNGVEAAIEAAEAPFIKK